MLALLLVLALLLGGLVFNREILSEATRSGFLTATDLADYLVLKNVPFRQAHAIVGSAVAYCLEKSKELADLDLMELEMFSEAIGQDVFEVLSVDGSVNSRTSAGGTAASEVEKALAAAEADLGIE